MNRTWGYAVAGMVIGAAAVAAEVAPEAVQPDEYGAVGVSLTGTPGDPAEGRKVFSSRALGNCVACHTVTEMIEDVDFHGNIGPSLDGIGSRWTEADLRGIVVNAKGVFDGTIMPSFYKTSGYVRPGDAFTGKAGTEPLPPLLTAQQVEDVVAYLMTLAE